jgi:hypothetical protein
VFVVGWYGVGTGAIALLVGGHKTALMPLLDLVLPLIGASPTQPSGLLSRAGKPLPKYNVAIMADACNKAAHFSSAGRAQRDVLPWSSTYLGEVARDVLGKFRSGELTSEAQLRYECAAAEDSCSSNLTCSRASASARGLVDFSGVSGVACSHAIPLLNCFVAMPAPEQWAFHIAALTEALVRRPGICHVYIDIACRLRDTFLAALQDLAAHKPPRLPQDTIKQASAVLAAMWCMLRNGFLLGAHAAECNSCFLEFP